MAKETRTILHCDLNSFYASAEMRDDPTLRGKPVAVCGSQKERHGIVLAKSEAAKAMGVKTGEAIWQAKEKCPSLITVPPRFERYTELSEEVKRIYLRYTDRVESFGIDECWLDVTDSSLLFGDGETIANDIRRTVRRETGLTVSVGVSFNKVFAKLGSDMKKPDAVTVIDRADFREQLRHVPASDMLWVGPATARTLKRYGLNTIGALADADADLLCRLFGKNGAALYKNANGLDDSEVMRFDYRAPIKSIGKSSTTPCDLVSEDEVRALFMSLSESVAAALRRERLCALKVQISIKDSDFAVRQVQGALRYPTQCMPDIAGKAWELFAETYRWHCPIRALGVRACEVAPENTAWQTDIFCDMRHMERSLARERVIDSIRERYGKGAISRGSLMHNA